MAAKMAKKRAAANVARAASLAETCAASSNGLADAHMALGPCAASSMELVLTSTTHGLASGKELVSSSEERKSEVARWQRALREFASTVIMELAEILETKQYEDPRAFAYEVVAQMKQRVQHLEESLAPKVTPLVSLPSARSPSAYAESPPECAVPVIGIVAKPGTNKLVGVKSELAVVAVQQVGVESIKPGTKSVGVKPVEPVVVESKRDSEAAGFTSIFFRVSKTVTDDQVQAVVGIHAKIGRRCRNRSGRILVPDDDVGRVLKLESVSGHKLRVEKWRSFKAPPYHTNRHGHQAIKLEVVKTKDRAREQARFLMEFLDAQAARPADRRLYSQAAAPNTSEARMKAMETAIYDKILRRLSERA